jgi:Fe-S cluster assembly iron-binding protein IscA
MFVRCPFCHRWVLRWFYASHEKKHTERGDDGQMNEHITAAPEDLYPGSLEGVPQTYLHPKCGAVTGMPEDIIRTYLVNPLTYSDATFCCGCGDYVDSAELFWEETGENLVDYAGRLRLQYLRASGMALPDRPTGVVITFAAAEMIRSFCQQQRAAAQIFLQIPNRESQEFRLDLATDYDPKSETVLNANGIRVIVPLEDVQRVDGVVIDYNLVRKEFSFCRLYAPPAEDR